VNQRAVTVTVTVTWFTATLLACNVTPDIPTHAPSNGELNFCVAAVRDGRTSDAITVCADCLSYDPDALLCHLGLAVAMLQKASVAPNADSARDLRASARCHLEKCRSEPRCAALAMRVDDDFPDLASPRADTCGHRHADFFAPLDVCQSDSLPTIELRNECTKRRERMRQQRDHGSVAAPRREPR
jgi:hypothetical protein